MMVEIPNGSENKTVFAPGCALVLYKPELASKLHAILDENFGKMDLLLTCCRHDPQFSTTIRVINICPGCDKRFGNNYAHTTTISLWEILADNDFIRYPDYKGRMMSIQDACPTRDQERLQRAVRKVLQKMNITVEEPAHTRTKSTCCGDSYYGTIPTDKVKEQMKKRISEMPSGEVVVYCVSCIKSVFIGGKQPRYMIDLLFEEETLPKTLEPGEWHRELDEYIEKH